MISLHKLSTAPRNLASPLPEPPPVAEKLLADQAAETSRLQRLARRLERICYMDPARDAVVTVYTLGGLIFVRTPGGGKEALFPTEASARCARGFLRIQRSLE